MEQVEPKQKDRLLTACLERISDYPDGPFVVPITAVLHALGMTMKDFVAWAKLRDAEKVKAVEILPPVLGD